MISHYVDHDDPTSGSYGANLQGDDRNLLVQVNETTGEGSGGARTRLSLSPASALRFAADLIAAGLRDPNGHGFMAGDPDGPWLIVTSKHSAVVTIVDDPAFAAMGATAGPGWQDGKSTLMMGLDHALNFGRIVMAAVERRLEGLQPR